jgi:hypothetical protein
MIVCVSVSLVTFEQEEGSSMKFRHDTGCLLWDPEIWCGIDHRPITMAARSKTRTVLAPSNTGIVGSNSTQGMDVCVCVYSMFVLSSV